jgi:hypothetical protein
MVEKILSLLSVPAYAQDKINLRGSSDQFRNLEGLTVDRLISGMISLVMVVVALVFFFMLVWGGLKWVMSQGDSKNVEAARGQITNALIGLAIVFAAWAIIRLIETVFGISIMNGIQIKPF